jgi:PQQ enzyme repeat
MFINRPRRCSAFLALAIFALAPLVSRAGEKQPASSPQDVLTYHNDNNRSGWFSAETQLTPASVGSTAFGLQKVILLDGRIDAEPLFVSAQSIDGQGVHDVVYVATETNSIYAYDAVSGAILWHRQYGIPVPDGVKNGDDNVYPVMGILSTPVIDRTAGLMYFVADSFSGGGDNFRLHAVSLGNGRDAVPPQLIQFTESLSDGTIWTFNPKYQLQRPALLEANGSIYVAFGSNGDIVPTVSRGTILRFSATTLLPMTGDLTDRLTHPQSNYYLSSIWQSGFGPVADAGGDIYFSTGNSDPGTPSYSQSFNRPDSMVRLSSDLLTLKDSFTTYDYFSLDEEDGDVGSGGLMILPDQPGSIPHLAIAGGKDGRAFLLNRDNMGGYVQGGPNNVVQTINMGGCWCGPSYYVGSDNAVHIVTGGGNGVTSWKLQTSPTTQLVQETSTGGSVVDGLPDDGGTVPVVSSNGTRAGTAVVWFVQRPSTSSDMNPGTPMTLHAYAATNLAHPLVSILGGTWTHAENSNANIVPTVAKGRVYVASNMQLRIYGLGNHPGDGVNDPITPSLPQTISCPANIAPSTAVSGAAPVHQLYGTVCQANGGELKLTLRSGVAVSIETGTEFNSRRPVLLTPGRPLHVTLTIDKAGVAHAQKITPAHAMTTTTPADR